MDSAEQNVIMHAPDASMGSAHHEGGAPPVDLMSVLRTRSLDKDVLLEVYENADSGPVGTQKSRLVHSAGLLHRTAYAFVFNRAGELLLWRRPKDAPLLPDRWDVTRAHVMPGHTPATALMGALAADLGLSDEEVATHALVGPLGPARERTLVLEGSWIEHELAEAFSGSERWVGHPAAHMPPYWSRVEGVERTHLQGAAHEAVYLPLAEVASLMATRPAEFSDWMREELHALDWFRGAPALLGAQVV